MENQARVVFSDLKQQNMDQAVTAVLEPFGGAQALLKKSRDVYLKVNAVDLRANCYTDPAMVAAVIRHFKQNGARDVYVIENCTQSNFTRLVFMGTGLARVCKETGAKPVYLDETGLAPIWLPTLERFINISEFVHERLIRKRAENLYVSLPKLKTHSMSQVTLAVKNQFGFVHQADRIMDHNWKLHQKFADIYSVIQPDFAMVDGTIATNHGHYPTLAHKEECVVETKVLLGGKDSLAVDTVGAAFLGYGLDRVEHLRLCAEAGLGQANLEEIEILGQDLFESRKQNFTHQLLENFPEDLNIIRGAERCCMEGCRRNTESIVEVLFADHGGKGGFTILMGKGIAPKELEKLRPPVHIAGSCAAQQWEGELVQRFGRKNVTASHGCNNLSHSVYALCRLMKVHPLSMAGVNPAKAAGALALAKLLGSKALIPPLL